MGKRNRRRSRKDRTPTPPPKKRTPSPSPSPPTPTQEIETTPPSRERTPSPPRVSLVDEAIFLRTLSLVLALILTYFTYVYLQCCGRPPRRHPF
uniref:Uncharacterized protein n=1 Tax=Bracon brevicornis TaxID=1563983 RepID=A0A6V7JHM1_9HYME